MERHTWKIEAEEYLKNAVLVGEGYDKEKAFSQAEKIYDTLGDIFYKSEDMKLSTNKVSDMFAQKIINEKKKTEVAL